ncbi:MAG: trypsin-like peptidase domain-containing protein [Nostocoides sp.]
MTLAATPVAPLDPAPPPDGPLGPLRRVARRLREVPGRTRTIASLLVVLLVAGLVWWTVADHGPPPLTSADVAKQVGAAIKAQQRAVAEQPPDAVAAYALLAPSLVTIVSSGGASTAEEPATVGTERLGSGVVVNADGSILTADHVIDGATSVQVTFADGTTSNARVASADKDTDTATLSVANLPTVVVPATLGGGARVGDAVYALGNPLGLRSSFTAGVVSAVDRTVKVDVTRSLKGLIQFDAAVNPGNSGGPLVNSGGQVIGIVTGLANPSAQAFFVGIGFAVPIASVGGGGTIPPQ